MIEHPNLPIIQSSEGRAERMEASEQQGAKLENLTGLPFRFSAMSDGSVFVDYHPIMVVVDPNVTVFLQIVSSRSRARGDNSVWAPPHLRDLRF